MLLLIGLFYAFLYLCIYLFLLDHRHWHAIQAQEELKLEPGGATHAHAGLKEEEKGT